MPTPARFALSFRVGLPALSALLMFGCDNSSVPMQKVYKTTGRVLLDGAPAAGVDVRFIPVDKTNFRMDETPLGHTDADGKFTLTTYNSGDGAPAGEYLVAVAYADQIPVSAEADETAEAMASAKVAKERGKSVKRFPSFYQVPQKSGLKATVPQGGGELPTFELSSTAK